MSTNEPIQADPAVPGEAREHASVHHKLQLARLYLVFTEIEEDVLDAALQGGVDLAELICTSASDEEIIATAKRLAAICQRHGVPFLLGGRPELVSAAGADGVHLSQGDDIAAARELVGPERIIGLSTHTEAEIDAAPWAGVDYISIGPVHRTWYAPDRRPLGTKLLTYASRNIELPFFAVGGIAVENTGAVAAAGAQRIAVSSAIITSHAPARAAAFLRDEVIHPSDFIERYRARTESQNAAARAKLSPLAPGERPPALLVSVALCALAGLVNIIAFGLGATINASRPNTLEIIVFAIGALLLSYGMWRRNYQSVLLFMAILCLIVVVFAVLLIEASNLLGALVALAVITVGGWLLWKLVRVAGRIQAPQKPPQRPTGTAEPPAAR